MYVSEDISVPPVQKTNADVRIMHESIRSKPFVRLVKAEAVPNLRHVCSARSLIPAKFSDIKVPVFNAEKGSQIVTKETDFEKLSQRQPESPAKAPASKPDRKLHVLEFKERVIAYALSTLSKTESEYETTRKELLIVVFGFKQYRQYLLGRYFVIRTDHAALSWLRRTPKPMPHLAKWLIFIEQFDYEVVHRDGEKHGNADGLSRRPPEADESTEDTKDDEAGRSARSRSTCCNAGEGCCRLGRGELRPATAE